jgi:cysteine-rich repeat protein
LTPVCRIGDNVRVRRGAMLLVAATLVLAVPSVRAATWIVAASGGDFTSVQAALDVAVAGDTIRVHEKPTPYFEKIVFPRSGDAVAGPIVLEAFPGEAPVLDGTGVPSANMVLIQDRSHVQLVGFEIRNNLGVNDGSGVRVLGAGSHVEIRDNRIHDIRGQHAMGITVYGTGAAPISDLVIDGNEIHDCEPFQSEALVLNGNVDGFTVTNNVVRDVNNIGIDFIGGETDIQPDPAKVARNGVCRGNLVVRARAPGNGYAGGIYVDGGRDIVVENNRVTESDLGIEIGAENAGIVASGIVVRNNVLWANEKAGLVFGGYAASVGRVQGSLFLNNTLWGNDTLGVGIGELWIQHASGNQVRNNLLWATAQNRLLTSDAGNADNTLDWNLWWTDVGAAAARFTWNGTEHVGFDAYRAATGQDASSLFAAPLLVAPGAADFHLGTGSPAINAGDPAFVPAPREVDLDGGARVNGPRVDIGADEASICGNGVLEPGEGCDDGDLVDGDGCDSNCTPTGCGNGIVTAGEECDDGNVAAGDCCGPACALEPPGSPCSDGDPCTIGDGCAAGACAGTAAPAPVCASAAGGRLTIKDLAPATRRLAWRWAKGTVTEGDLGDPVTGGTSYTLCVYDATAGSPGLLLRADAPAGGTCGRKPCWTTTRTPGFRYRNGLLLPGALRQLRLRAGDAVASISAKAKGANLPAPDLPLDQQPAVTVQLRTSAGACWGATYTAPASRNDATRFVDTAD